MNDLVRKFKFEMESRSIRIYIDMERRALPDHMVAPVVRWVLYGHHPGGFLDALLSNDLVNAFRWADDDNAACMKAWAEFLENDLPPDCWGSKAKFEAWSGEFRIERDKKVGFDN